MNTLLWIFQILLCIEFLASGINKSTLSEKALVAKGQTGVEGLPAGLIRFIGISEILGSIGIIIPWLTRIRPVLTPVTAVCFAFIMIPASVIHFKRYQRSGIKKELGNVTINTITFLMSAFVAYGRF